MTRLILGAENEGFVWWSLLGPKWAETPHYLIMGPVVALAITGLCLMVKISLSKGDPVIPKDIAEMGFFDWIRSGFEMIIESFVDLVDGLMPHHHEGRKYLWLIVPIFIYVLVGNLFGMIPGFLPPTNSLNTNFAIALCVFVAYNVYGVVATGPGYLKHFWAPSGMGAAAVIVGPLLLVIELVGHVFRPVTLSLRLFANMTGDHQAFSIFSGLVPIFVPALFMMMGLIVCLVQAYVFALLTAIYVALATAHDH
jgi:F-type H+-transporting ATPase subunit a